MNNLELCASYAIARIKKLIESDAINDIAARHSVLWEYIKNRTNNIQSLSHDRFHILQQQLSQENPDLAYNIDFMSKIISNYPGLLADKIKFVDLMFINGDFTTIENLYLKAPEMVFYNNLAAKLTSNITNNESCILELGAGIGATSQSFLPLIHDKISNYDYTDISKIFTYYAKNVIKPKYNKVKCFNYNIDSTPSENMRNKYDIIISTDALHNAIDIEKTLKNINLCLKNDGYLVINELTKPSMYSNIIYGLTPEWWDNKDKYRVGKSPILSVSNWVKVLQLTGFTNIQIEGNNEDFSHNIIISQKA